MKKPSHKKLRLDTETVRALDRAKLDAAGGMPPVTKSMWITGGCQTLNPLGCLTILCP
jgi:hypothetical protein